MSDFSAISRADENNPDLIVKLAAECSARNALNKCANKTSAMLWKFFDGLVGSKVINADGSLSKRIRSQAELEMLFCSNDGVQHWFEPSPWHLWACFKTGYQGPRHFSYLEKKVLVACLDQCCVVPFTGSREPSREDYTVAEIVDGAKEIALLESRIDTISRNLYEFRRFDWNS